MIKDNKKPTIVRVILALAAVINDAAIASGIASFSNETLNYWYHVISFIFTAVVMFIVTYYNNDFTPEGAAGTAYTRQLKEINKNVVYEDKDTPIDDDEVEDDE